MCYMFCICRVSIYSLSFIPESESYTRHPADRAVRRVAFQTARSAFMEALSSSELAGISSSVARARVLEGPQERSVDGLSGSKKYQCSC